MRSLLISSLCFIYSARLRNAQLNPRATCSEKDIGFAGLQQALVPRQAWKPFPQSAAEWSKILPDSITTVLIKNGEFCIQGPFPNIPATVTLELSSTATGQDMRTLLSGNVTGFGRSYWRNLSKGKGGSWMPSWTGFGRSRKKRFGAPLRICFCKKAERGCPTQRTRWSTSSRRRRQPTSPGRTISSEPSGQHFTADPQAHLLRSEQTHFNLWRQRNMTGWEQETKKPN